MSGLAGELFRYHTWANQRLIDFCAALSAVSPGSSRMRTSRGWSMRLQSLMRRRVGTE